LASALVYSRIAKIIFCLVGLVAGRTPAGPGGGTPRRLISLQNWKRNPTV
jgi:hypothetical protein